MKRIVLDSLVQVLEIVNRRLLANNGELGAIHSVPFPHTVRFDLDHLREFLQDAVSEGIAVNFVQSGELVDAYQHNLDAVAHPSR